MSMSFGLFTAMSLSFIQVTPVSFCLFTAMSAPIPTGNVIMSFSSFCLFTAMSVPFQCPFVFSLLCPLPFLQVRSVSSCLFTAMSAIIYTSNDNGPDFSLRCSFCLFSALSAIIYTDNINFLLFVLSFTATSAIIYTSNDNGPVFLSFNCCLSAIL